MSYLLNTEIIPVDLTLAPCWASRIGFHNSYSGIAHKSTYCWIFLTGLKPYVKGKYIRISDIVTKSRLICTRKHILSEISRKSASTKVNLSCIPGFLICILPVPRSYRGRRFCYLLSYLCIHNKTKSKSGALSV